MLNHEPLRLADGEYRFACLVWDNEPLPSGQLVALAAEGLGWKKSTTYTVLKKLCERGVLQNADGRVTSLIKKEDVQQAESAAVVDKTFDGSLPRFVAAFLNSKPISDAEAAEIRRAAAAVAGLVHHAGDLFLLYPDLEALELGVELRDQRVDGLPVSLAARFAGSLAELHQR